MEEAATLLTDKFVPGLAAFGKEIGKSVGQTAKLAAEQLTSKDNMTAWGRVLAGSQTVFDKLGDAVVSLSGALPKLFAALMPMAEDLAGIIADIAAKFADWINKASASGVLEEKLDLWWRRAKRFGGVISDVAVGVAEIFDIGAGAADPMMRRMARIADSFREWTQSTEGKNKIKEFFENAMPVLREFNRLVGAIFKALGEPVLTGDTGGIIEFMRTLRVDVLPMLETLADQIVRVGAWRRDAGTVRGHRGDPREAGGVRGVRRVHRHAGAARRRHQGAHRDTGNRPDGCRSPLLRVGAAGDQPGVESHDRHQSRHRTLPASPAG